MIGNSLSLMALHLQEAANGRPTYDPLDQWYHSTIATNSEFGMMTFSDMKCINKLYKCDKCRLYF